MRKKRRNTEKVVAVFSAVSQQPEMNEWITVIKGQGDKLRQIIARNFICSRWRNLYDSS